MSDAIHSASVEDRTILEIGRELSARMGLSDFGAQRIFWVKLRKRKFILPDLPSFSKDGLYLSDQVKGRLAPEDWRGLLFSSLVYDRKLRVRRRLGSGSTYSGFVLAILLAYFLSSLFLFRVWFPHGLPSSGITGIGVPFILLAVGCMWAVGIATAPYMRHLIFLADNVTQQSGLGGPLLAGLKKLEAFGFEDYPFRRGRYAHVPSVSNRIRRLEKQVSALR